MVDTINRPTDQIREGLDNIGTSLESLKSSISSNPDILDDSSDREILKKIITNMSSIRQSQNLSNIMDNLTNNETIDESTIDTILTEFIEIKLQYTNEISLRNIESENDRYQELINSQRDLESLLNRINQNSRQAESPNEGILSDRAGNGTNENEQNATGFLGKIGTWITGGVVAIGGYLGINNILNQNTFGNIFSWFQNKISYIKQLLGLSEAQEDQEQDQEQSPETAQIVENPNDTIESEDRINRNRYIYQSIDNADRFPIDIEYGDDYTSNKSINKVSFDKNSQSIFLGGVQLKMSVAPFQARVNGIDANITSVKVENINIEGNEFVLDVAATGKAMGISRTQAEKVKISREDFKNMIKPYLDDNQTSYTSNINVLNNDVNIKIEVANTGRGGVESTENNSIQAEEMDDYQRNIYTQFTSAEQRNFDELGEHSRSSADKMFGMVGNGRLPEQLHNSGFSREDIAGINGGFVSIMSKYYGSVNELLQNDMMGNIGDGVHNILDRMIDFIAKARDRNIIGWFARGTTSFLERTRSRFNGGARRKEDEFKRKMRDEIANNSKFKQDVEKAGRQMTFFRFYLKEKEDTIKEQGGDQTSFRSEKISNLSSHMSGKNILDENLSSKTTLGLQINKIAKATRIEIENTGDEDNTQRQQRREARSSEMFFDYEKQELRSRGRPTKIEIRNGKYFIGDFDEGLDTLEEAVWLANLSNRLIHNPSLSGMAIGTAMNYYSRHNVDRAFRGGIYRTGMSSVLGIPIPPSLFLNTHREVTRSIFMSKIKNRDDRKGGKYTNYLNRRLSLVSSAG